jgi:hypothetical protein
MPKRSPPTRRHLPRRPTTIAAAALVAAVQACAPVVTHGPRVERGPAAVATVGASMQPCMNDGSAEKSHCPQGLTPAWGVGGSYGWVARDTTGPAYLATGMLTFFDAGSVSLDVYRQGRGGPRGTSHGVGAQVSVRALMPYVQFGRVPRGARGWYTTQGVVVTAFVPEERLGADGDLETLGDGVYAVYWAPALAYVRPDPAGAVHLYVAGALGRYHARRYDEGVTIDGPVYSPAGTRTLVALRIGGTLEVRSLPFGPGRPRPQPRCRDVPLGQFCPPELRHH